MGGSAIKFPRAVSGLTVLCLLLGAFTTTWGGLRILPAGQIGDVFISLALVLVIILVIFGDLRFSTPVWVWIPPFAVVIATAVRWFDPIPASTIMFRYVLPPYALNNFPRAGLWIAALIVVPIVVCACIRITDRTPQLVMGAFCAGVCVSSAVALSDLMGFTRIASTYGIGNDVQTRQPGLSTHSVMFGFTCIIAIPMALYFLHTLRRHRWIPVIALALLYGGALASGSRGAQAASVVVLIAALIVAPNKRAAIRGTAIGLGLTAVVLITIVQLFVGDILTSIFRFGTTNSDTGESDWERSILARQAVDDILTYPIAGRGMKSIVDAHSIYLQIFSSGGIIVGFAMLIYWFWMLKDAWQLSKRGHQIARYLFVVIGAWLVMGVIQNVLTDRLLFYSVGCIAAMASVYLGERREPFGVSGAPPPAGDLLTTAQTSKELAPAQRDARR